MLKKSLIAAAVLSSISGMALADVAVYGRIDTGIYAKKTEKIAAGKTTKTDTISMASGSKTGSRWGLKGKEDLGNGYKIGFVLESGFNSDTGEAADSTKHFNRDSYLELTGPMGGVQIGRTGALTSGVNGGIFAGKASPFGITYQEAKSTKVLYVPITRVDNMVRYESPKMAGFKVYAQYSNGVGNEAEDENGNSYYVGDDKGSKRDRLAAIGASYQTGPVSIYTVIEKYYWNNNEYKDRDDTTTYNIAAQYKLDNTTLYAAYQYGDNVQKVAGQSVTDSDVESDAFTLGAKFQVYGGDLKLAVGYVKGDGKTAKGTGREVEGWNAGIGYDYPLSKNTTLYAAVGYFDREYTQFKKAGPEVTEQKDKSFIAGIVHFF